jgi:succinate dehydrogenase flavin-adding protein (antitoxin of CptAB toxin-antitoxin module)
MDFEKKEQFNQILMLQDPTIIEMFSAPKAIEDLNLRHMVTEILGSDQGLIIQ